MKSIKFDLWWNRSVNGLRIELWYRNKNTFIHRDYIIFRKGTWEDAYDMHSRVAEIIRDELRSQIYNHLDKLVR